MTITKLPPGKAEGARFDLWQFHASRRGTPIACTNRIKRTPPVLMNSYWQLPKAKPWAQRTAAKPRRYPKLLVRRTRGASAPHTEDST